MPTSVCVYKLLTSGNLRVWQIAEPGRRPQISRQRLRIRWSEVKELESLAMSAMRQRSESAEWSSPVENAFTTCDVVLVLEHGRLASAPLRGSALISDLTDH